MTVENMSNGRVRSVDNENYSRFSKLMLGIGTVTGVGAYVVANYVLGYNSGYETISRLNHVAGVIGPVLGILGGIEFLVSRSFK